MSIQLFFLKPMLSNNTKNIRESCSCFDHVENHKLIAQFNKSNNTSCFTLIYINVVNTTLLSSFTPQPSHMTLWLILSLILYTTNTVQRSNFFSSIHPTFMFLLSHSLPHIKVQHAPINTQKCLLSTRSGYP